MFTIQKFASMCHSVSSRTTMAAAKNLMAQQRACFSVLSGTVKWFDTKKGFGFIIPDDGSEDVFVHQTSIHSDGFRSLAEGEPVEFTVMTDDRGKVKAERVTGPMGAFVQGAPRRSFDNNNFGGGGGGGFGGGGFGGGGFGGGGFGGSGGFGGGSSGGGGFGGSGGSFGGSGGNSGGFGGDSKPF